MQRARIDDRAGEQRRFRRAQAGARACGSTCAPPPRRRRCRRPTRSRSGRSRGCAPCCSSASSRRAMISSRSFRIGFRDGDRYRFFASCCVIVLAPRANRPCSKFVSIDSCSCSTSTPSCSPERASSATSTARFRFGEMRFVGDPPLVPPRRLAGARAPRRPQLHERRRRRVGGRERPHVRQRQVDVREHAEAERRAAIERPAARPRRMALGLQPSASRAAPVPAPGVHARVPPRRRMRSSAPSRSRIDEGDGAGAHQADAPDLARPAARGRRRSRC